MATRQWLARSPHGGSRTGSLDTPGLSSSARRRSPPLPVSLNGGLIVSLIDVPHGAVSAAGPERIEPLIVGLVLVGILLPMAWWMLSCRLRPNRTEASDEVIPPTASSTASIAAPTATASSKSDRSPANDALEGTDGFNASVRDMMRGRAEYPTPPAPQRPQLSTTGPHHEHKQVEDILQQRPVPTFSLPRRQRRRPGDPLGQPDVAAIRAAALRQLQATRRKVGRVSAPSSQPPIPTVSPHIRPGWAQAGPAIHPSSTDG